MAKTKYYTNLRVASQFLVIFMLFISCDTDETINGSGNLITETRGATPFTKVSSEGVFEVTINQGATQSVEITADDNVIGRVKTRVVNDELQLYLDDDYEGGELEFPNFNFKMRPRAGMLVYFPSDSRYRHSALAVTSGTRHAIVTWMSLEGVEKVRTAMPEKSSLLL